MGVSLNKSILYVFLILVIFDSLAFAAEKETIAVANFDAKAVSAAEAEIVASFLRSDLVNSKQFVVLDRNNMDKILNEQKFQRTGCTSMECAVEVGKILNVRKMVVGTLSKLGTYFYLEVSVVDVESSAIVLSIREKCENPDKIEALTRSVAMKLSGADIKESTGIREPAGEFDLTGRYGISAFAGVRQGTSQVKQGNFYGFNLKYGILSFLTLELDGSYYDPAYPTYDIDLIAKFYFCSGAGNFQPFAGIGPTLINFAPWLLLDFEFTAGLEYFVNKNMSLSLEVPVKNRYGFYVTPRFELTYYF